MQPNNLAEVYDINREALKAIAFQADKRALPSVAKMLDCPFELIARDTVDAVGAIVGMEFKEEVSMSEGFNVPLGSPPKAIEWLNEHPEALYSHHNEL